MSSSSTSPAPNAQLISLEKQAIADAQNAFRKLRRENADFEQCIAQKSTLLEVLQSATERQKRFKKKRLNKIIEGFNRYTLWLQNMSSSIDVAVNVSAGIACPVWAPVKFILVVSNDYVRSAEEIFNMIKDIEMHLPRFEEYARLKFEPDSILRIALLRIFTTIVEFSAKACYYFKRRTIVRWFKLVACPFKEEFGDILNRLERNASVVDATAVACHIAQSSRFQTDAMVKITRIADDNTSRELQDLRLQCEERLKPLNTRSIHSDHTKLRMEGTCEWIWSNPSFERWYTASPSVSDRILFVHGPHGCGKSVLASSVAQSLLNRQQAVLYYSFSGMNSNQKNIGGMVSTLIWQLLQDSSDQGLLRDVREKLLRGPDTLELWTSFKKLVIDEKRSPLYCIIDGVDECLEPTKDILEHLKSLHDSDKFQFRTVIFGRPAGFIGIESPVSPSIEMNPSVVESDIERFIKRRVQESTTLNSSNSGDRVINTLKEKSEGMFLWVKLMTDHLSQCGSTAEVRDGLQDLPRGLQDAYRQMLLRRINTYSKPQVARIRRILSIVTSAFRALEIEELNHACAIDALSATTDGAPKIEEHLFFDTTRMITEVCGDFINVSNGFVQLVHFSLKEFLTRPEAEWSSTEDKEISCFRVDPDRCHLNLGMLCIDYMALNDYESPMQDENSYAENHRQYPFLGYAARHLLQHFTSSAKPLPAAISKIDDFLKSKPCTLWIEYLLFFFGDDYGGIIEISDQMEKISEWIDKTPEDTSTILMQSLVCTIQEEYSIRSSTFGNHDPRTQRWRSLVDMILSQDTITQEINIEKTQLQVSHPVAPLDELVHVLKSIDTSTVLARNWQIDTIIRLQSYLQRVNTLIDPLRIIFQLIMQKASAIPALGLVAISQFYWRFDKFDESNQVLDAALKKIVDKEIPLKYRIYHLMGANYHGMKDHSKAERLYRQAFVGSSALRGLDHQDTIWSMYWVAMCLYHQEKYADAESLFRRSLELRKELVGMDHSDTINYLYWVAMCLYHQEKYADAESLLRRSLELRQKVLGTDHSETIWSMYWVAVCLYRQKK
ncbi:hypothetical protein FPQ18DRAFT_294087, partial [Pyronema domesticum]